MSHSSTSNSSRVGWRRIRRDALRVGLILLALELILHIGPVHQSLKTSLDSYENLLWYDPRLPSYQNQLLADPNYTFWLLGSSPMMTALNPLRVQDTLRERGHQGLTVQNYGFTVMTNFEVMSRLVDRWMLQLDQPQYVVIGISDINYHRGVSLPQRIENSPLERATIFGDEVGEVVSGFLYEHSLLYRYGMLLRYAFTIPLAETRRDPRDAGGYSERDREIDCADWVNRLQEQSTNFWESSVADGMRRLDELIDVVQSHDLPVIVVTLPIARCWLETLYGSMTLYRQNYLDPVIEHLKQQGILVIELDTRYYDDIPLADQNSYFDDPTHANQKGADLLSVWLAESLDDRLKSGAIQAAAG